MKDASSSTAASLMSVDTVLENMCLRGQAVLQAFGGHVPDDVHTLANADREAALKHAFQHLSGDQPTIGLPSLQGLWALQSPEQKVAEVRQHGNTLHE
jgi:hypothetical protein